MSVLSAFVPSKVGEGGLCFSIISDCNLLLVIPRCNFLQKANRTQNHFDKIEIRGREFFCFYSLIRSPNKPIPEVQFSTFHFFFSVFLLFDACADIVNTKPSLRAFYNSKGLLELKKYTVKAMFCYCLEYFEACQPWPAVVLKFSYNQFKLKVIRST